MADEMKKDEWNNLQEMRRKHIKELKGLNNVWKFKGNDIETYAITNIEITEDLKVKLTIKEKYTYILPVELFSVISDYRSFGRFDMYIEQFYEEKIKSESEASKILEEKIKTYLLEDYGALADKNAKGNFLFDLGDAYNNGEFGGICRRLAKDCVWESQWVLQAKKGIEEVTAYYKMKGEQIKNSNSKCYFQIVELSNGDIALKVKQKYDEQENEVLILVEFAEDNFKVRRIDICIPNLYEYRVCNITKWDYDDYYQKF